MRAARIKKAVARTPIVGPIARKVYRLLGLGDRTAQLNFRESAQYWEDRYRLGGNSGAGSYNRLAEFKAEVLNDFVASKAVSRVLEFGCGDGAQFSLAHYPEYIGVDVAESAIEICRRRYETRPNTLFYTLRDLPVDVTAELTLSLDVIYHLVEDQVFENYMRILFDRSTRYVIVYASNSDRQAPDAHVRHRKFTNWIELNQPKWCLIEKIGNRYPFREEDPDNTSFCDFYIFEKRSIS